MTDATATPADSTSTAATTTTTAAASTLYYEFTAAVTPDLPTYTGRSFTTDSPNTTTVAPPAVTDDTMIQYWLGNAWFIGKKESEIAAGQINKYIADVVYMRSQTRSTKAYPAAEIATFDAQYQGALAVKAGQTSDLVTQLAEIRGIAPFDMATLIISKHDSIIAQHIAFTKATYGLQALASEVTSLSAALATGLIELYPLLQWINNPKTLTHKILNPQPAVSGESNG